MIRCEGFAMKAASAIVRMELVAALRRPSNPICEFGVGVGGIDVCGVLDNLRLPTESPPFNFAKCFIFRFI